MELTAKLTTTLTLTTTLALTTTLTVVATVIKEMAVISPTTRRKEMRGKRKTRWRNGSQVP